MKERFDPWQKRTDLFSLLLGFFFFLLMVLFGYLVKIDRDIEHYNRYNINLEYLQLLNGEIERVFDKRFRFVDYDQVNRAQKEFDTVLNLLSHKDMKRYLGEEMAQGIQTIALQYNEKVELLEDFKILNARMTNSIHYLYELRMKVQESLEKNPVKKHLIDDVLFTISQILMDMPYNHQLVTEKIEKLFRAFPNDKVIQNFVEQSRQFFVDIVQMDKVKEQAFAIPLHRSVEILIEKLRQKYQSGLYKQKVIVALLFLFTFVILALLIYSYRRIRKDTRELEAFRHAIEESDNAIIMTDIWRNIKYVNKAFEVRSGYTKEEVIGKNPNILKSGLMDESVYKRLNETINRGETWQGEIINRKKDGTLFYERESIIPIFVDNELVRYLGIKLDITEYKEQQIRLKQAAAVYQMIGDGIIVMDKEKKIITTNPAFTKMFGYAKEELRGKELRMMHALDEENYHYNQIWNTLLENGRWAGKIDAKTKDGTLLPTWLTLTLVRDDRGEIENFIAIYANLQEIIATQEKAEYLAYHDSLTGLPNRAYFDMRIVDILDVAKNTQQQVAVLFLDLDRFKVINDTLGHSIGDEMLVEVAKRMKRIFDENILLARLGGDEFVITFLVQNGKEEVEALAQKILAVIREPIHVQDYYLNTTGSIGIALFPDDAQEKNQIIKYADSAMYAAKERGKDTYHFYNKQLSLDVQARLSLEQELLYAIEEHEFYLHFQPQYDLKSNRHVGVEALLRWHSKVLGDVSPDQFISIAEETGAIVKIGYFVFEEACSAYVRWKKMGLTIESIAVNVSTIQFGDEHFIQKLQAILERTGMPPEALEIEITEHFIMEYSTSNMTILDELRALGCIISIDDFGTGYSSMSYMKRLPLDIIKIDRSFIADIPHSVHDVEVSKAIIALAHSLGYKVIAEGVETPEQEAFLKRHQCEMAQGYYFARPMDEASLIEFLKKED